MSIDEVVAQLKAAFVKIVVQDAMAQLIAASSAFAFPVVSTIVSFIVERVAIYTVNKLENAGYFSYVDIFTSQQAKAYKEAAEHNAAIQKTGTEDEKKKAEQAEIDAARILIKWSA